MFIVVVFMGVQKTTAFVAHDRSFEACSDRTVRESEEEDLSESLFVTETDRLDAESNVDGIKDCLNKINYLFSDFRSHDVSWGREVASRIQRNQLGAQNLYLRLLLFYCSLREVDLSKDKERLFPTTFYHCVVPSCRYFVFALREIII